MSLPTYTANNVRQLPTLGAGHRSHKVDIYADGRFVGCATISPELAEHLDPENYPVDRWADSALYRHIEDLELLAEDCDEIIVAAVDAIRFPMRWSSFQL